jgi:hypothetical protein
MQPHAKMNRYVDQLLEDIEHAAAVAHLGRGAQDEDEERSPEDELLYARRMRLSERIGIARVAFPPLARLTEAQANRLEAALEDCLHHYGYVPLFPPGLEGPQRYVLLYHCLNEEVPVLYQQLWHFECCKGEPLTCPLGEACAHCFSPPLSGRADWEAYGDAWSQHPDAYHWNKAFPDPDHLSDSLDRADRADNETDEEEDET